MSPAPRIIPYNTNTVTKASVPTPPITPHNRSTDCNLLRFPRPFAKIYNTFHIPPTPLLIGIHFRFRESASTTGARFGNIPTYRPQTRRIHCSAKFAPSRSIRHSYSQISSLLRNFLLRLPTAPMVWFLALLPILSWTCFEMTLLISSKRLSNQSVL